MFCLGDVLAMLEDGRTHRKQFSQNNGVQKNKRSPTFSVPFDAGLCQHFLDGTNKVLNYNHNYDQHYCFLRAEEDVQLVESWAEQQGARVFIRNLLSSTIALDHNFTDNTSGQKTVVGQLEEAAKHSGDESAISELARISSETIIDISYLKSVDMLCAVPAAAEKVFDMPRELAKQISHLTGIQDLTPHVVLNDKVKSAKDCALEDKWATWEEANIEFDHSLIAGKRVLLVDDKYQSGLTMHFVAAKFLEAGAAEVHGIAMVKTLRDTDNLNVVES